MSGVIDVTTSLGDLVTSHPQLARELERCGLDYCCGGHRTLAAACAADRPDLDAMTTIDELRAVLEATNGEPPAWAAMDVAELTEHIETTHHRHLRSELPRLSELLAKVTGVHGHRHPELHAIQAALCRAAGRARTAPGHRGSRRIPGDPPPGRGAA